MREIKKKQKNLFDELEIKENPEHYIGWFGRSAVWPQSLEDFSKLTLLLLAREDENVLARSLYFRRRINVLLPKDK